MYYNLLSYIDNTSVSTCICENFNKLFTSWSTDSTLRLLLVNSISHVAEFEELLNVSRLSNTLVSILVLLAKLTLVSVLDYPSCLYPDYNVDVTIRQNVVDRGLKVVTLKLSTTSRLWTQSFGDCETRMDRKTVFNCLLLDRGRAREKIHRTWSFESNVL